MLVRFAMCVILALTAIGSSFAEATSVRGLHRYRLDNGLELFVLENHEIPLARIQITFRCGAVAQSAQTAGLFQLYERMLFKGNSRYGTETEFSAAMAELGVDKWYGGTGAEYATYYCTVPSDSLDAGLEFWSYAVTEPLLDAAELELQKALLASELEDQIADPDHAYLSSINKALFPDNPWQHDTLGNPSVVRNATVDSLRALQNEYYLPNNAALFVGGDVYPDKVYNVVNEWYGDWKQGPDPWAQKARKHRVDEAPRSAHLVLPDETLPPGIAYMELRYRGPDVASTPASSRAAELWSYLQDTAFSEYKKRVFDAVPALYDTDYLGAYYYPQRYGGQVTFYAYCYVDPASPLARRVSYDFFKAVVDGEASRMASDGGYLTDAVLAASTKRMSDERIIALESPQRFLHDLSFWWSVTSIDYVLDYESMLRGVTRDDIAGFLREYILELQPVIALRMNPVDYAAERASLEAAGFVVTTPEYSLWWKGGQR
ncbi:MAG: insulinase family protein [Spirochaetales bacterium]|nr:insulinase family protein [Spirochaetales bacterium]